MGCISSTWEGNFSGGTAYREAICNHFSFFKLKSKDMLARDDYSIHLTPLPKTAAAQRRFFIGCADLSIDEIS
jgi:hypothetical protein